MIRLSAPADITVADITVADITVADAWAGIAALRLRVWERQGA